MKHLHIFLTLILAATIMNACSSKPKVDPEEMQQAANVLSSVFKPAETVVTDTAITLTYNTDTIFNPNITGSPVLNYFVAERMRTINAQGAKEMIETLHKAEAKINLVITNGSETVPYTFTATQLQHLRKAARIDLDLPAVRAGLVNLAESLNGERFKATEGVHTVNVSLENGFITYTLVWDAKKKFDKSNQGLLTARYQALFTAQLKAIESVFPGFAESVASAGIDGLRVQYATGDDAKVALKEAFPWRVLI